MKRPHRVTTNRLARKSASAISHRRVGQEQLMVGLRIANRSSRIRVGIAGDFVIFVAQTAPELLDSAEFQ